MKAKSLPSVIREADRKASLCIRKKAADHAGMVKCCTCETRLHWTEAHAAHYVERACKALRWVEENLHPACPSCNVFRKERHKRLYTRYIVDTYGEEKLNEFDRMERMVLKPSDVRNLAEEAIADFTEQLKGL